MNFLIIEADKWGEHYEMCGSGKQQSPVAIETSKVFFDENLLKNQLKFADYTGKRRGHFINNGHTVVFKLMNNNYNNDNNTNRNNNTDDNNNNSTSSNRDYVITDDRPMLSGFPNNENYTFASIHFHWGDGSPVRGSEHTIDGVATSLEVHLVHFNVKYRTLAEALPHRDGLAVLGFLFESKGLITLENFDDKDNTFRPLSADDTNYLQFAKYLPNVTMENQEVVAEIDVAKLIPKFARDGSGIFFRYDGSLTTPPCYEVATNLFSFTI